MMKKILKYLLFVFLFTVTLMYFFPKKNFYFLIENRLNDHNIVISDDNIVEKPFSLSIKNSIVYYDKSKYANVENIDISLLLISNDINVSNIKISDDFKSFLPSKIDFLNVNYTIFNPLYIHIKSQGEFGELVGSASLLNRTMTLYLKPSKRMIAKYKNILSQMINEEGKYKYEYKF